MLLNFDGVVESPIYAPQEVPLGCKVQRFFRNSAYYVYCLVSEKSLRIVYGTFYLAPQGHFLRAPSVILFTRPSKITSHSDEKN